MHNSQLFKVSSGPTSQLIAAADRVIRARTNIGIEALRPCLSNILPLRHRTIKQSIDERQTRSFQHFFRTEQNESERRRIVTA